MEDPGSLVLQSVCDCSHPLFKVLEMFRGSRREDMPPHIFSVAQQAYHALINNHSDQSLVLLGLSGSGKTFNARHIMRYLASAGTAGTESHVTCKYMYG